MEDLWSKKVLIIRAQESVITRGIARKLEELECAVIVEAENAPNLKEEIKDTELVLMYLSSECINSPALRAQTAGICSQIEELMKQTIVVGEKEQKDNILEAFPVLKDQIWLNRPVDMELLEKEVRAVFSKPEDDGERKNILVVDDDPAFGKMIREWLKDYYKVSVVTNGMQAITFLAKRPTDLVLLDYEMPVTDGPMVLEMMRAEKNLASIPVVFLTGVNSREQVNRVLSLKPHGYILKSTSFSELLKYLRELFRKLSKT